MNVEPHRLRRWRIDGTPSPVFFHTCARPGRSGYDYKKKDNSVPDVMVSEWVCGLPGPDTAIVSLLGRKPKSGYLSEMSEFTFYSFCGGWATPLARGAKPTFQQWLMDRHEEKGILVREYPTYDHSPIPARELEAIVDGVRELIADGRSVVIMDSGGEGRVGQVSEVMQATEVLSEHLLGQYE